MRIEDKRDDQWRSLVWANNKSVFFEALHETGQNTMTGKQENTHLWFWCVLTVPDL
jgi:hypothetical protein